MHIGPRVAKTLERVERAVDGQLKGAATQIVGRHRVPGQYQYELKEKISSEDILLEKKQN